MTIYVSPSGDFLQLDKHLERLKGLVADLELLRQGIHPDLARMESAAFIDEWTLDTRPVSCLRGYVEGHPTIRSGRMGLTSDIWVWAPERGYARTISRYYALGRRASDKGGRRQ